MSVSRSGHLEEHFKQLRHAKAADRKSFVSALFPRAPFEELTATAIAVENAVIAPVTEVKEVLKSLESLAVQNPAGLTFPGGELVLNDKAKMELESPKQAILSFEGAWPTSPKNLLAVFVGERPKDAEVAPIDMLGRMISAMKLGPGSFERYEIDREQGDEELARALALKLAEFSPRVIVAMGAFAANLLLSKNERLSKIHGQIFKTTISNGRQSLSAEVVPVFHPDYLIINPNMKRAAWEDLQKVMGLLSIS